jgi:hypothetical protein
MSLLLPHGGLVTGIPVTVSLEDSSVSASDATEYTFSSQAFGTAATNRHIVVAIGGRSLGATVTGVTIGGVSATELVQNNVVSSEVAIFMKAIPTGTTGDVVVTWSSGGQSRCGIGVWAVYGASITPNDTGQDTNSVGTLSDNLNVPAGGAVIGYAYTNDSDMTWAGVTERFDDDVEGNNNQGGASDAFAAADATKTITVTVATPSSGDAMACVALKKA